MAFGSWKSWAFWIVVILVFLVVLWLISGRQKEPYIGATTLLNPLVPTTETRQEHRVNRMIQASSPVDNFPSPSVQRDNSTMDSGDFSELETNGVNGSGGTQHSFVTTEPKSILKKTQGPKYQRINNRRPKSKGETECLRVMKELFGVDFYTVRPNFLTNPETGCNLEIDVFNEDLTVEIEYQGNTIKYNIGVEYNGIQHVCWPNFTKHSLFDFIMQIRRDQYKLEECDKRNIYIITVPHNIPVNMIRDYIIWFLPNNAIARKKQRDLGHNVIEYPPTFPQPPQIQIDNTPDHVLKETLLMVKQRVIDLGWADPGTITADSILPPRSPGIRY